MTKRAITITIGNQKGGMGKTTTTMLMASLIHTTTTLKVAVVDIDPQQSISKKRKYELAEIANGTNPALVKFDQLLKSKKKGHYDIHVIDLDDATVKENLRELYAQNKLESLRTEHGYDLIFVDFPGIMMERKYVQMLTKIDYCFVPVRIMDVDMDSTIEYIDTVAEFIENRMGIRSMAAFSWRHESAKGYQQSVEDFSEYMKKKGRPFLTNVIPHSKQIENNKSTIMPFDLTDEKSITPFMKEIMDFIKKDQSKK